jgi:Flp pilus assembly protein TadG
MLRLRRSRPLRLAADRNGAIAVMMALAAVVLLGVAGLAVDVASWETAKRAMQGAADHAAYSGAIAAGAGGATTVNAQGVAAHMGFVGSQTNCSKNGQTGVTVCVNSPPAQGLYKGNQVALEVVITQPQKTFLSHHFLASVTASARAVALEKIQGDFCILALKNVANAFQVTGTTTLDTANCNIQDNSAQVQAASWSGSATINTKFLSIVGGYTANGTSANNVLGTIIQPSKSVADPFATLAAPSYSGCNGTSKYGKNITGTVTLSPPVGPPSDAQPLVFCNGLTINAGAKVTMQAGDYVFDRGGLTISGGATVSGAGVHIFLTSSTGGNWATITINGSSTVNLTTDENGPLAGILIYADRRAPYSSSAQNTNNLTGGGGQVLTGTLYFPTTAVTFNGGTSGSTVTSQCTQIVAATITMAGSSGFQDLDCTGITAVINDAAPMLAE